MQVGNVRGSTTALLVPILLKGRATSGVCWKDAVPWNTTGSYSVILKIADERQSYHGVLKQASAHMWHLLSCGMLA